MIQLQFTYRFEAAHRFTKNSSQKCSTPHGHTWRATLLFKSLENHLNQNEMVEEFTFLKSQWKAFITETVDHSFFHHYEDPILPTLKEHIPHFRGLPFPGDPTTELVAGLFLEKARTLTSHLFQNKKAPVFPSEVIILETPTNSLSISLDEKEDFSKIFPRYTQFTGWWKSNEIQSRSIEFLEKKN